MLKNLFRINILRDNDGGGGAGGDEPNTDNVEKVAPKGEGQDNMIKVGDETFDRSDPKVIDKLLVKAVNLQTGLTQKSQELSKIKKETPKVEQKKEVVKEENIDPRIDFLYNDSINSKIDNLINTEKSRFKTDFGDNYEKAETKFNELTKGIKDLPVGTKEQMLKRGNLNSLFANSLAEGMRTNKTTPKTDPKTDIGNFKEQETLPQNVNQPGKSTIAKEVDIDKELLGDVKFKKASAMAKKANAIRGGESIR